MLLMVFGTSSFGMTVHFHYCCGKLKAVDFTPPKDKHCGNSQQMGAKLCCEYKELSLKVSSEQELTKDFHPLSSAVATHPVQQYVLPVTPLMGKILLPEVFASPPRSALAIYILNNVFRI